jgi:hypothetical protein
MPYSNSQREMTIPQGCPWHQAQQSLGAPNVNWCEATQCSWVTEPANTWSNLGYILVGIYLMRRLQKSPVAGFGLAVLVMGALSLIYHATNNFFTQTLDFVGMFLMMSYLLAFHCGRIFSWAQNFMAVFWFGVAANTFMYLTFNIFDWPVQPIMLINALPLVALDLFAGIRHKQLHKYLYFVLAVLTLITAQAFAIMDIQRIYCEPDNLWLHGHVIWHLLGAVAMLFAGLHMEKLLCLNNSN